MAKNQNSEDKPKVSKLPLPVSDSPLVIDLPDGQKIVIGKMTSGSVIEVATWRGVGRPDSRTSRLMLGVGTGNVNEEPDSGAAYSQQKKPVKPQGVAVVAYYLQVFGSKISSLPWNGLASKAKKIFVFKKAKKSKSEALENKFIPDAVSQTSMSSITTTDPDIEEWLNRISERAAKSTAKRSAPVKSAPKKVATSRKAAPKPSRSTKSR